MQTVGDGAVHAVIATDFAEIRAVGASTAIRAHQCAGRLDTFAAVGAQPAVGLTAICAVLAAADALTELIVAEFAVGAVIAFADGTVDTQIFLRTDVTTIFTETAVSAVQDALLAVAAGRTGCKFVLGIPAIFFVTIDADVITAGTQVRVILTAVTQYAVTCAVVADVAVRAVGVVRILHIALPAVFAGLVFVQMALQAGMLGAAGAYAAAIVAPSAAAEVIIGTGAGAALVAVMIIVAGASAVAAAVRSVVADVVIAASGMAELALDDFVPCEDFQRTRTENQQQTQQQTKDFLCLFLHSDPLLFGIDLQ
jgi:hypothetical protein